MNLPDIFNGDPTKAKWAALGQYLQGMSVRGGPGMRVRKIGNHTVVSKAATRSTQQEPNPFQVDLINDGGTYYATVSPGLICERIPKDGDAVVMHEPDGIFEGGDLKRYEVAVGQSIYVFFETDDKGGIKADPAPSISVSGSGEESLHYHIHPVGDQTAGAGGGYYYELAKFIADPDDESGVRKESSLEGSHIDHWHELPPFKKAGGAHDIFKEFDFLAGIYKTKGLSAGSGIAIDDDGSSLTIRQSGYGSGLNLNIEVHDLALSFYEDESGFITACSVQTGYEVLCYKIRGGILVGTGATTDVDWNDYDIQRIVGRVTGLGDAAQPYSDMFVDNTP